MGYVNNGTERSLKVTVNKVVGGNQVQGYPKTYDGQLGDWSLDYAALTDEEFRQLTEGEFTARYNAFVAYVEGVEYGADFDTDVVGDGAIRAGAACTTTTTVYVAPGLKYFSIKYGDTPALACSGQVATVASYDDVPGVGSVLYVDAGRLDPFNSGQSVVFVSPDLYAGEVAGISLIEDPDIPVEIGQITSFTGYKCTETQTTTVPITTIPPVTTIPPSQYYFTLYRCDTAAYYKYGPVSSPSGFTTGMKVEGATDVFYVITAVSTTPPNPLYPTITGITFTGSFGCL